MEINDYAKKRLIVFDLDGTLAVSKQPLDRGMAKLMRQLLDIKKVAIVSGGRYEQFQKQFLANLEASDDELSRLFLFPVNGTSFYHYQDGLWQQVYSHELTIPERHKIKEALLRAMAESGVEFPKETYGEAIEDRGSQISLSAVGQDAPPEVKKVWDPDQKKRIQVREFLEKLIPEFSIGIGGMTTLDITRKGIDKGFAIAQMERHLDVLKEYMLFIGDGLFPGGNDEPVRRTGVECVPVSGPEETEKVIEEILAQSAR